MSVFSSTRARKVIGGIAAVSASALILAGCTGTTPTTTPTDEALTLKIGTVLPQTGQLAFLGPPEEAGVALAVDEINAANKGITVEVEYGDSGDPDNKAFETSVPRLRAAGVVAMIGAASSGVTKLFLDENIAANVITFSPANTSPDFTDWPGKNGLYWRTAPSDNLQGEVLANLIAEDGHSTLGILYLNDAYGVGLEAVLSAKFTENGGTVVASEVFNSNDTTFDSQVAAILAQNPSAIAIIAFEDATATSIPAFVNNGFDGGNFYLVDGNIAQWGDRIPVSIEGSKGTQPGPVLADDFQQRLSAAWTKLQPTAEPLADFNYAGESYDAVVLMALAALKAKATTADAIKANLREVSGGTGNGTKCTSFAACADIILGGGTADYDGYSGNITFDEFGDPTEATIGIFQYGADNRHTRVK